MVFMFIIIINNNNNIIITTTSIIIIINIIIIIIIINQNKSSNIIHGFFSYFSSKLSTRKATDRMKKTPPGPVRPHFAGRIQPVVFKCYKL